MERGLIVTAIGIAIATSVVLWKHGVRRQLIADAEYLGFPHPDTWNELDRTQWEWTEENESSAKEEDAKIREWTLSDMSFEEIAGGEYWYGLDTSGYPEEWASAYGNEKADHRRLTLLADLIANEKVSQRKREQLFGVLYMRLYNSLSAPYKFFFLNPTNKVTQQSQGQLLKWCEMYSSSSRHGAIEEYCKDVKEVLDKKSKYKRGYSSDWNKGISYDGWLQTVLWPRMEKWFPVR